MSDIEKFEEKTLSRREVWQGRIIKVLVDEVELPGNLGHGQREIVQHPGGVGVLAVTSNKKMLLVRQFRKAIERVIYEIPAGKIEPGELQDLHSAILRELEEETGYSSDEIEPLTEFFVSPGISNEKTYIFYASKLTKLAHPKSADPDETLELHEVTLDEAKALIKSGDIDDAKTIIAVQQLELLQLKARASTDWQFGG